MASEKLLQRLSDLWSVSEGHSRWYEKRLRDRYNLDSYLWMLAVRAVQNEINRRDMQGSPMTDKDIARHYPDIVKRAVTDAEWQKIKPEGWE